ncbi:alpha/beta hydrolase family protein [Streptomyces sp. NPDC059009]|uniref:alpha/beta hydrolase family protein n=1 Tax=Streptomyces sp. NPDC059009 TaxID=3346694 RepID=UPI0036BB0A98
MRTTSLAASPRVRRARGTAAALAALVSMAAGAAPTARADTAVGHFEGTLPSGAAYAVDAPEHWNGTVLLFSHGYRPAGSPNPAQTAPDDAARKLLLKEGYALVGSSYATTGWAVEQAVPDQLGALDAFTARVGAARRTLAWGQSYGGLVTTALAERHADRIDGSLSMCGLVHGGVANWNSTLDPVFALRTLLAPHSGIRLTGFRGQSEAAANARKLSAALTGAQSTPTGRARIALAAALHAVPGWNDPKQPRPAPGDHAAQQANQYAALTGLVQAPAFSWRQEAEARAGGSMSWNTGVDYSAILARSSQYEEVKALYKAAGHSLEADLDTLAAAPRLKADRGALAYMKRNIAFTGRLTKPQLNIHTTGDALVPVRAESAYRSTVTRAGRGALFRQAYVGNAGHCTFSPAEELAAVHVTERRIATGRWGDTSPAALDAEARRADPTTAARYEPFRPGPYPRPYDLASPPRPPRQR